MIYLVVDIILSYFSKIPTFFFLINIVLIKKQELSKLIIIGLIIDILILNTYFLNTIILICIFLVYKKLKITKITIKNYILSLLLIYIIYIRNIKIIWISILNTTNSFTLWRNTGILQKRQPPLAAASPM